jgi:hypothetical protein
MHSDFGHCMATGMNRYRAVAVVLLVCAVALFQWNYVGSSVNDSNTINSGGGGGAPTAASAVATNWRPNGALAAENAPAFPSGGSSEQPLDGRTLRAGEAVALAAELSSLRHDLVELRGAMDAATARVKSGAGPTSVAAAETTVTAPPPTQATWPAPPSAQPQGEQAEWLSMCKVWSAGGGVQSRGCA